MFYSAQSRLAAHLCARQSGVLKPGEMCLVLGCPGSGCTTFLKSVTNQRQGLFVSGDVRYAGMSAEEMEKYYQGEVVFNEEGLLLFSFVKARN